MKIRHNFVTNFRREVFQSFLGTFLFIHFWQLARTSRAWCCKESASRPSRRSPAISRMRCIVPCSDNDGSPPTSRLLAVTLATPSPRRPRSAIAAPAQPVQRTFQMCSSATRRTAARTKCPRAGAGSGCIRSQQQRRKTYSISGRCLSTAAPKM